MFFAVVDMTELGILLGAVFAAFVGIMGAFFKYMAAREKDAREERQDDRKAFSDALAILGETSRDNTMAMREVAEATKKAAQEAKDRNGHLGEQNIQITDMIGRMTSQIKEAADRNFDAIKNVKTQKVEHQIVEHETVRHQEG